MKGIALFMASTAILVTSTAHARGSADPSVAQEQVPVDEDDTSAAQASTYDSTDIVVTAQRRSERLQDVPISITAITSSALEAGGVQSTDQIAAVTPGLVMVKTRNTLAPFLRGIGTQNSAAGDEGSIATYVDGVYYASPTSLVLSLSNIERIEVLKGPQGTLFGRNATGGLIQIITPDPSHEPQFDASISYGNYDTVGATAYVTGGITETLAADIAVARNYQGQGWGRNLILGQEINKRDEAGIRTKWLWTLTGGTRVTLAGDYFLNKSDFGTARAATPGSLLLGGVPTTPTIYDSYSGSPTFSHTENYGGMLRIEQEIGSATLTSLTAARETRSHSYFDLDATPAVLLEAEFRDNTESLQQELLLQGDIGRLNYTTGIFYYRSTAGFYPNRQFVGIPPLLSQNFMYTSEQKTTSIAAYAQGTYAITDSTNLTLGARYTHDKRTLNAVLTATEGNPTATPGTVLQTISDRTLKASKPTWRIALDHHFTRDIMAFGSFSRGFKSGVFNTAAPNDPPVDPETLDSYEAGIKTQLFDRVVLFNVSAFHYRYNDVQLTQVGGSGVAPVILNAASARVNGLETEFVLSPRLQNGTLQLRLASTVLDGKYKNFPNAPFLYPSPAVCNPLGSSPPGQTTGPAVGGNLTCRGDAAGNRMIRAPEFSSSVSLDYSLPVSFGTLAFNATWQHTSSFFWDVDNRVRQPAYDILNGQIGVRFADDQLGLRLFARNLLDEKYFVQFSGSGITGDQSAPGEPRAYGVAVDFRF